MELPPLEDDLRERLREDIRLRRIQRPILVDNATGEVIDGRLRKQIAAELKLRDVPTIFVGLLFTQARADLRLAVNIYEALKDGPEAKLLARIKVQNRNFLDLPIPDGSVGLIFTDPPWGGEGRVQMPEFAAWAARKLKPDGGALLIDTGHAGLREVGGELAKTLNDLWTISCGNGHYGGTSSRHDLQIRCCWRPILMFARGKYQPERTFEDAVISKDRDETYHDDRQPLSEALFFVKALSGSKTVVCEPSLGSGTTACAVARLGQGRRFWGLEVDPDTCSIARRRVAEELGSSGTTTPPAKPMSAC